MIGGYNKKMKIAALIVTYNRIEKLKKTLNAYENQKRIPDYIIVVDNASTDGTTAYLDNRKWNTKIQVEIIHSAQNVGGSGGFYLGEKRALSLDADWIMIADDDAYPEADYIEGLEKEINNLGDRNMSIVCGTVMDNNGISLIHRTQNNSRYSMKFHRPFSADTYQKEMFFPDFVSYVGILVNKKKLKQAGLVRKDFFIWNDDTEHTHRLHMIGDIICFPKFIIRHDADPQNNEFSWKNYYGTRNTLVYMKEYHKMTFPFVSLVFWLRLMLSPLKGHSLQEVKMRIVAYCDAVFGRMGIHNLYKPGWKYKADE